MHSNHIRYFLATTSTTTELPPTTTQPPPTTTTPGNKVTVKIVIETPYDPTKVSWKVKIGSTNIVTGKTSTMTNIGSNGYETYVDLDAGVSYKFVVIDGNTIKDTFWEVWSGGDVLVDGDHGAPCNCRKIVDNFTL